MTAATPVTSLMDRNVPLSWMGYGAFSVVTEQGVPPDVLHLPLNDSAVMFPPIDGSPVPELMLNVIEESSQVTLLIEFANSGLVDVAVNDPLPISRSPTVHGHLPSPLPGTQT